jgi:mono/diheme cytochrome c family protein
MSTTGRRVGIVIGVIAVIGLAVLAWAAIRPGPLAFAGGKTVALSEYSAGHPTGVPADFTDTDKLARGKYLTEAADCQACHTTEGGTPFAGGRPFDTQFGTMYSPNITADTETGIGSWSDADFLKAVHEGVGKGGLRLYPAFPYAAYTYLTDEDVLAIKSYLWSLPVVKNTPPPNALKFPFDQRWLMAFWAAMYDPNTRYQPHTDRSPQWNRGGARPLRRLPHTAHSVPVARQPQQVCRWRLGRLARLQSLERRRLRHRHVECGRPRALPHDGSFDGPWLGVRSDGGSRPPELR